MRLTLRAMLAYMNGLLEPEDAQDIAKRIEESETATKIFHRIRDAMKRVRSGAPGFTERQLDPNTVAEYLDNTMPADRVPDFEKICLESDARLAEVAACHQILVMLGEPAEIDPASRERMCQLPAVAARAEAESRAGVRAAGDGTTTGPADVRQPRPKPTVPEYLREPRSRYRWLRRAGLFVLAVAICAIILLATGQFEPGRPLRNLWDDTIARLSPQPVVEEDQQPPAPETKPPLAGPPGEKQPAKAGPPAPQPKPAEPKEPPPLPKTGTKPQPPPGGPPEKLPAEVPAKELPGGEPKLPTTEPKLLPPEKPLPEPPTNPPAEPRETPPAPGTGSAPVGRSLLEDQVLLKYDPVSALWRRVKSSEAVLSQQRLIALPTYRPRLVLGGAVTLQLCGGTLMELLPGSARAPVGAAVYYGRVRIEPPGQAGVQFRLVTGRRSGVLTLVDAESEAAVEVAPVHVAGMDPEKEPPRLAVDLYVVHGEVVWQGEGAEKPITLHGPARMALDGRELLIPSPVEPRDFPKWITGEISTPLDDRAAGAVAGLLQPDRPADLVLTELTEDRRKEIGWLAVRSLGHLGHFKPLAAALENPGRKLDWPDYVEQLRQAVGRGPESAAAVRKALEKQFGADAPTLYRMLWGYSNQDLQNGQDARLVANLEHDKLAVRVLAFWNLKDITGLGLWYKPEVPAKQRQVRMKAWHDRLQQGEIRIRSGDEKLRPADLPPAEEKEKAAPAEKDTGMGPPG